MQRSPDRRERGKGLPSSKALASMEGKREEMRPLLPVFGSDWVPLASARKEQELQLSEALARELLRGDNQSRWLCSDLYKAGPSWKGLESNSKGF